MRRFQEACVLVDFFARTSHRAMVAAMRARYDQFGKQMIRDALEDLFFVETDAEVPAVMRRIDVWIRFDGADRPCAANPR